MSSDFLENNAIASAAFIMMYTLLKNKKRRRDIERIFINVNEEEDNLHVENPLKKKQRICKPYKRCFTPKHVKLEHLEPLVLTTCYEHFASISRVDFESLIEMVGPKIFKMDTRFREAIPVEARLGVTLRFMSTGESYRVLGEIFDMSKQIICRIIPEVCKALIETFEEQMKPPSTPTEWGKVVRGFDDVWGLPNCLGVVDGREVSLQSFVQKDAHVGISLVTVIDANYNFQWVDVGCHDMVLGKKIFESTGFYQGLKDNTLGLPPTPGDDALPFYFIGGDGMPLTTEIMVPASNDTQSRCFNTKLNDGKRIAVNAIGLFCNVFSILNQPILLRAEKAQYVVLACAYLHNFLKQSESSRDFYAPKGAFDEVVNGEILDGKWRFSDTKTLDVLPHVEVDSVGAEEVRSRLIEQFYKFDSLKTQ